MTRAALLVMASDPYLNAFWFRNYRTYAHHIDELHILVYGMAPEHEPLMRELAPDARTLAFLPRGDHGVALRYLYDRAYPRADTVVLLEDDAFVRDPAFFGECFARIERGEVDVIGCPRGTGTHGIIDYANSRFGGWRAEPTGEEGPLLWPTFAFLRIRDVLRTDHNFSVWGCAAGSNVLGHVFPDEQNMDTFGWMTLQLRALGLRFGIEPNYRAQRDLLTSWTDAPWFHVGGLSAGYGLYFAGNGQHSVAHLRGTDLTDWEKRVAFWQLVSDDPAYRDGLAEFMATTGMDQAAVDVWRRGFAALL